MIAYAILWQKKQVPLRLFLYGAFTFVLSQIVLRLPLLQYLQAQNPMVWMQMNLVLYLGILSISAGLFEECGRWIAFHCVKRPLRCVDAIGFGLGHGGIEAILLVGIPMLSQSASTDVLMWALAERIMAMMAHVCFTLLIWIGWKHHQRRYVGLAILAHACFNFFPIYIGTYFQTSNKCIEGMIGITTIFLVLGTYQLIKKERIAV